MTFSDAVRSGFSHYFVFGGRASRAAYWWWFLFALLAAVGANIIDLALGTYPIISFLVGLGLLLPNLSVAIRRLHDINRSGWWFLIFLIPIVGLIMWLVWFLREGDQGRNDYGRPGLEMEAPRNTNDQRAELLLGALACVVLALIAGMIIFVFEKAWPSFTHNGLDWFSPFAGGSVDEELAEIFQSPGDPSQYQYTMHAWPLIYSTALITVSAVVIGTAFALLSAMFIVEFAPTAIQKVLEPVVRLLAAVPSVIYGLIGILVIVPFVGNHLISTGSKNSVAGIIQLSGTSWGVGTLILTIMITPIMIAIVVDALRAVPSGWSEGALSLGINRWRALWTVSVRAARPAIVAAAVLATARALGEAIMLSMVTGSAAFAPNPLDGIIFFVEPSRPLAATIVDNSEGLSVVPFAETLYAFAAVLLISAAFLSFGGWYIRRRLRRFTLSPI